MTILDKIVKNAIEYPDRIAYHVGTNTGGGILHPN